MSEIITLGPVGINPRGEYNSETEYEKLDVVTYQGSSYVAKQSVVGQVPTTEYWQKLVSGGVGVDDIVDNLDSNDGEKPLSAKQGNNLNKSKVEVFDTVAQMKAANLKNGMVAETLGYYSVNDGGGATYKITNVESETDYQEELENGLYASLIVENNTINVKQLGARPQDKENNKYDLAPYLEKYKTLINNLTEKVNLYIPAGVWYTSPVNFIGSKGFSIIGDESFVLSRVSGTFITSLNNNQDYIFKIGNNTGYTQNWVLKNIIFSTAECLYKSSSNTFEIDYNNIKNIGSQCVKLLYATFGITDNLFFEHINGQALNICSCWENYFGLLNFRHIDALNSSIFCFDTVDTTLQDSANITACDFEKIMFEQVLGDLIEFKNHCKVGNCHIGTINFEDYKHNSVSYTTFTDENIDDFNNSNPVHNAILSLTEASTNVNTLIIDNIQLNNFSSWYATINETNYCHDTICKSVGDYNMLGIIIGNIDVVGMNKNAYLLISKDPVYQASQFIINTVKNYSLKDFVFDIEDFTYIDCKSRIKGVINNQIYRLTNLATPCYKLVNNKSTGNRYLKSETGALNELGIVLTQKSGTLPMAWILSSKTLVIRAKIPDGQTATLAISGSHSQTLTLVGTGEFKCYEIEFGSQFNLGDNVNINYKTGETQPDYCYYDYIIN